jgi:DNA repair protein SbcC/Rad50
MRLRPLGILVEGFLPFLLPQEIDLRDADIYCLSGRNGSGKSSLLNAITFCLFGMVLGKRQGVLERIINHRADQARVVFTFELDRIYRATRTVTRRKSQLQSDGIIEWFDGAEWRPVADTSGTTAMQSWLSRKLKLTPESFTSSIMLMQGDFGSLFTSGKADQQRIISDLAGLDFYRQLADYAKKEASKAETRLRFLGGKIEEIEPVDEQRMVAARAELAAAEALAAEASAQRERAVEMLSRARERERLDKEIVRLAAELDKATTLSSAEGELRLSREQAQSAAAQYAAVAGLVRIREALDKTIAQEAETRERLQLLRSDYETSRALTEKLAAAEEEARAQHRITDKSARQSRSQADTARRLLAVSESRARVVADVARIRGEIETIGRETEGFERVQALIDQRPVVANLVRKMDALDNALSERDAARLDVGTEQNRVTAAEQHIRDAENALAGVNAEVEAASVAERDARTALENARDAQVRLQSEADLMAKGVGQSACLVCLQDIDEQTQEALAAHLAEHRGAIASAVSGILAAQAALVQATTRRDAAQRQAQQALARIAAFRNELEGIQKRISQLQERAQARHETASTAWREALAGAGPLGIALEDPRSPEARDRLRAMIDERKAGIDAIEPAYRQMAEKRALGARLATEVGHLEGRLAGMEDPGVSESEARRQSDEATQALALAEAALAVVVQAVTDREVARRDAERRTNEIHSRGQETRGRVEALSEQRVENEGMLAVVREQAYDSGWDRGREPSMDDVEVLKAEADRLPALRREHEAAVAAMQALGDLRGRLDAVREEHGRVSDAPTVEDAIAQGAESRRALDASVQAARALASAVQDMEARSARRAQMAAELVQLESQAALLNLLIDPLGRKMLQARLLHGALAGILDAANDVLARISDGNLQLELELGDDDDDWQIVVRDAMAPDQPIEFLYVSGGMKFRVAVAMAMGIGEYLAERSGTQRVGMLVIDEGFGSLDDEAQDALIDELERIASEVGTVIVVSHTEKVKEAIFDGYLVERVAAYETVITRTQAGEKVAALA